MFKKFNIFKRLIDLEKLINDLYNKYNYIANAMDENILYWVEKIVNRLNNKYNRDLSVDEVLFEINEWDNLVYEFDIYDNLDEIEKILVEYIKTNK